MSEETEEQQNPSQDELEQIVERISVDHDFDVRGYKRSTLYRRIRKRMADAGCGSAGDYLVRLESDRQEYPQLVNTILINVTEFFRDPDAWEYLQEKCLRPLVEHRPSDTPIRAWSIGCASGEEAYTLAICLAEVMENRPRRDLKIYATDVDEAALVHARAGVYRMEDLKSVSSERVERFFEELPAGRFRFRRELRSQIIFGRHNVLTDAPISRLDLIVCRNLLIYFDFETQQQLIARFNYALRDNGFLILGKAETLMTRSRSFRPVERRYRIFQRLPQQTASFSENLTIRTPLSSVIDDHILHAIVRHSRDSVLVLDAAGRIRMASDAARELFQIAPETMGCLFAELEEQFRPAAVRLAVEDVRSTGKSVRLDLECVHPVGYPVCLDLDVQPILDAHGTLVYVVLWGRDETRSRELDQDLARARQELQHASEELQTTNEELETTNEELQSTNEELETTNEELQSTNEELETTIEELQSTNEELETTNDELRGRQAELDAISVYHKTILAQVDLGLILIDGQNRIEAWDGTCEATWGLRSEEAVGRDLCQLDIGLPVDQIRPALDALRQTGEEQRLEIEGINRRGRPTRRLVRLAPVGDELGARGTAILIDGPLPDPPEQR